MAEHREMPRLLRRLWRSGKPTPPPSGAVEARLAALEEGLREVRGRLNWLLVWMSATVLAAIVLRLTEKL